MLSEFLLVSGVLVLAMALRSFRSRWMVRLGTLCLPVVAFLAGWLLVGNAWAGVACVLGWLLLPWFELLTRLRRLRMPAQRVLADCPPPSREEFPPLQALTAEIEEEGFERLGDVGWVDEAGSLFCRVFGDERSTTHVALCLASQNGAVFFYHAMSSRLAAGRVFLSSSYPFAEGLRHSPTIQRQRVEAVPPFLKLVEEHRRFLRARGIADGALLSMSFDELVAAMGHDFQAQIRHNVEIGLLHREADTVRYSFRGLFFLWVQFLRDLLRLR